MCSSDLENVTVLLILIVHPCTVQLCRIILEKAALFCVFISHETRCRNFQIDTGITKLLFHFTARSRIKCRHNNAEQKRLILTHETKLQFQFLPMFTECAGDGSRCRNVVSLSTTPFLSQESTQHCYYRHCHVIVIKRPQNHFSIR